MSARDLAKLGQMMLEGGKGIVSASWIKEATTPYSDSGSRGYGYHSWYTGTTTNGKATVFPAGSYHAPGSLGQRIYVDPSRDLVVATTVDPSVSKGGMSMSGFAGLIKTINGVA